VESAETRRDSVTGEEKFRKRCLQVREFLGFLDLKEIELRLIVEPRDEEFSAIN